MEEGGGEEEGEEEEEGQSPVEPGDGGVVEPEAQGEQAVTDETQP